jgi:hypothetical protein
VRPAERRRQEEIRNHCEEARRDHFDGLVQHWRRNQERRAFLAEARAAAGVTGSEMAQWFAWAEEFIESADVVTRFRPSERTLTLYYSGYSYDLGGIGQEGFRDPSRLPTEPSERWSGFGCVSRSRRMTE